MTFGIGGDAGFAAVIRLTIEAQHSYFPDSIRMQRVRRLQ